MEILEDCSYIPEVYPVFKAGEESGISKISTRWVTRSWSSFITNLSSLSIWPAIPNLMLRFFSVYTGHGLRSALSWGSLWEKLFPGVSVPQRRDLWLSDRPMPLQPRLHRGTVSRSCWFFLWDCWNRKGSATTEKIKKLLERWMRMPMIWLRVLWNVCHVG